MLMWTTTATDIARSLLPPWPVRRRRRAISFTETIVTADGDTPALRDKADIKAFSCCRKSATDMGMLREISTAGLVAEVEATLSAMAMHKLS